MVSSVVKPQLLSFTSLPDEIIENCLARISLLNYPSLSLVSKKFRSLLSSKELYKTRSQIGTHDTFVCLKMPDYPCPRWFHLRPKPNSSTRDLLVPILYTSPPVPHASTISVGSEIYVIGGSSLNGPSSFVWILDCRTLKWRNGPNMTVPRKNASANLLDDKIYVMGGCEFADNWMEVFDIKTQSWTAFSSLCQYTTTNVVEETLHVVLCTKESLKVKVWCVVENVIYGCTYHGFCMWYDLKGGKWEGVKGLEELREKGLSNGNVLDIAKRGGKLLVMWWGLKVESGSKRFTESEIWYAEISLERVRSCNGSEIWGKIECVDLLLTVPCMSKSELELSLILSV